MNNISLKNNNIELSDILEVINSLSSGKEEQEKSIEIIENGTTEIIPDDGKALSKVTVTTNIEIGGDVTEERSKWIDKSWTEFSDDEISKIAHYAFAGCTSLTSVDLPICSSVGSSAFLQCRSLTSVNLPICKYVGDYAFTSCYSLKSIDLPECRNIGRCAFSQCTSLASVNLPMCSFIDYNAFQGCTSLTSIDLPVCNSMSMGAFQNCTSLTSVNLPICSFIHTNAFSNCISLTSLTLGYSNVVKLSSINAFQSTPMSISTLTGVFGSIYVPASLVDAYKSATNWVTYKDRITTIAEILDINDINIVSNDTKNCEIQIAGFTTIPDNIAITLNDDSKLNISNIQASTNNISFNITSYDICDELNATISLFYNGKTYTKSFKIIITESPIGDFEVLTTNANTTNTISVPWFGSEPASNLSVISSDESKISVSNIQSNVDNISFNITSYDVEDEVDITITAAYNNTTFMKIINLSIQRVPTYTVENLNTDYTFVLNSNGYYESNNKNKDNTFAICKVNINTPYDCRMYVDCINYAEGKYDFGILSNLNAELSFKASEDGGTSVKKSFKNLQMETIQTVEYDVPAGKHFIYVKYLKDSSQSKNNDSLQFTIRFE